MIVFGARHRRIIDALGVEVGGPRKAPKGYLPTEKVAEILEAPRGSVAGHLRVMARKGWVESVMSGGRKAWRATPEGVHLANLERMREEWKGTPK